jgi:hypothetical protein
MKATFDNTNADNLDGWVFEVTGKTAEDCVDEILYEYKKMFGFTPDETFGFDRTEAVAALNAGKTYERVDFSTPEDDFVIRPA